MDPLGHRWWSRDKGGRSGPYGRGCPPVPVADQAGLAVCANHGWSGSPGPPARRTRRPSCGACSTPASAVDLIVSRAARLTMLDETGRPVPGRALGRGPGRLAGPRPDRRGRAALAGRRPGRRPEQRLLPGTRDGGGAGQHGRLRGHRDRALQGPAAAGRRGQPQGAAAGGAGAPGDPGDPQPPGAPDRAARRRRGGAAGQPRLLRRRCGGHRRSSWSTSWPARCWTRWACRTPCSGAGPASWPRAAGTRHG